MRFLIRVLFVIPVLFALYANRGEIRYANFMQMKHMDFR